MWEELGDSRPPDGEKPKLYFRLFAGKFPRKGKIKIHTHKDFNILSQLFLYLVSGPAVPLGEELVSRSLLSDSTLCPERAVYPSRRNMGGNGKIRL